MKETGVIFDGTDRLNEGFNITVRFVQEDVKSTQHLRLCDLKY